MNIHDPNIATPKVTTGALPASRKVYARPDAAPELRVPVREIALTEAAAEPDSQSIGVMGLLLTGGGPCVLRHAPKRRYPA